MTHPIDAIIDSNESYAYVTLTKNYGYGHMTVVIRGNAPKFGFRKSGVIKITCQIGGATDQSEKPYAIKFGFDSQDDCIDIAELEQATKLLKKIKRYISKIEEVNGYADTYAEYCHRILVGSGVKHLIAEAHRGVNGGSMKDKELCTIGGKSRAKLIAMESTLIAGFSRKTA